VTPRVSVVVSAYDSVAFIDATMHSILASLSNAASPVSFSTA
jgi:hypothetical protein